MSSLVLRKTIFLLKFTISGTLTVTLGILTHLSSLELQFLVNFVSVTTIVGLCYLCVDIFWRVISDHIVRRIK